MAPLDLNFSSLVVLLAVVALAFLAVRRIVRRGLCDSGGTCDSCGKAGGCSSCSAVDKMVADMERAALVKKL
ncbi:MAG TPA: hypothetical protein IAC28_04965 [Candidatus Aphodovivens excrementavium]|nr:hypothetical protein [Candidatus Aphodovivens excrementavium]